MGRRKANDSILARRFFEAKAFLDLDSEALLVEHLAMCNRLTRTLFNRSIAQKIPVTDISSREASLTLAPELEALNVDQANLVSRTVVAKRKRAVGLAKHRVEEATKLVKFHRLKIDALERVLTGLQGPQAPAESDAIHARRAAGAGQVAAKIARRRQAMREQLQIQRLAQHEVDSGLASVCFGGSRLAAQRHDAGAKGSAFKSALEWKNAWEIARNGSYFFEGNGVAVGRNRSVKAEVGAGGAATLRIRLSEQRAELLMAGRAEDAGIALEEFMAGPEHSPARMACRFLIVNLTANGKRQLGMLEALATALTQAGDDAVTVAWTISWAWEAKPDGSMARRFKFRASWAQPVEEATDAENGAVGFQVSDGLLRWAWVDRTGNPAKGRKAADGSELPWHGSMPVGAAHMPDGRRLQLERDAANALARIAAQRQCPCAVEAVSIPLRRVELGLKHSTKLKPVVLEVRPELGKAIELATARFGVRTIGVVASYAAELGFAKFGACKGLCADSAAAVIVARAALPSLATRTMKNFEGETLNKRWDGPPAWATAAKATPASRSKMRKSSRQQSMDGKSWNDLKAFSENLGKDRSIWGSKLKGYRTSCRAGQLRPAKTASPGTSGRNGGGPRNPRGVGSRAGKAAQQQAGVMPPTIQTKHSQGTPSEPPSMT